MVRQQRHRVAVAGSRITVCVASMDRLGQSDVVAPASKLAQIHELPHGLEFSRCTGPRHLLVQRRQGGNPEARPCLGTWFADHTAVAETCTWRGRHVRLAGGREWRCMNMRVFVLCAQVRLGHIVETR